MIPLDFAIQFMTQNGISRDQAGTVMSAFGITELISRIVCAVTGEQKVISKAMIYILSSLIGAAGFLVPIIVEGSILILKAFRKAWKIEFL